MFNLAPARTAISIARSGRFSGEIRPRNAKYPPFGAGLNGSNRTHARAAFERRFDIERVAHEYVQIYRGLVRAEETLRDGKRNGVKQSLIPRAQRGYRPILGQLGAEVSNATQVD